jgi:hypothetical protein
VHGRQESTLLVTAEIEMCTILEFDSRADIYI